jgi:hypothetical protein
VTAGCVKAANGDEADADTSVIPPGASGNYALWANMNIKVQQSLFSRGPVRGAVIRVTVAIGPISSNAVLKL